MTLLNEIESRRRARGRSQLAEPTANEVGPNAERGYAVLISVALFAVNATLSTLARAQYGQEVVLTEIIYESLKTVPVFVILVFICHPFDSRIRRGLGFMASVFCGCYIVTLFNTEGYYASMARVPAIGAVWVWLFIELEWYFDVATLAITYAYTYIRDYSLT